MALGYPPARSAFVSERFRTMPRTCRAACGALNPLTAQNKTTSPLVILFLEVLPKDWDSPTVVPPKL
jgi:hypothetical protein